MFTNELKEGFAKTAIEITEKINENSNTFVNFTDRESVFIEMETSIKEEGQAIFVVAESEFTEENYEEAKKLVESVTRKKETVLGTRSVHESTMSDFSILENVANTDANLYCETDGETIEIVMRSKYIESVENNETDILKEGFWSNLLDAIRASNEEQKERFENTMKNYFNSHGCSYLRIGEVYHESWIKHFNMVLAEFDKGVYSPDKLHFKLLSYNELDYELTMAIKVDKYIRKELSAFDAYIIHSTFTGYDGKKHVMSNIIGKEPSTGKPVIVSSLIYLKQITSDGKILVPPLEIHYNADRGYVRSLVSTVRQMSGCLYRN